jgi:hypothetical protein
LTPDYSPKGTGRLIDEAIAVYRAEFRTLAVPAAYVLLPGSLLFGLAQGWYSQVAIRSAAGGSDPFAVLAALAGPYSLMLGVASMQALVSLYYFACVLAASPELLARRPVAPGAFLKGGAGRFLWLVAISFVASFLGGVGFLFLVVPGVLVYVYLSMAEPVAGVEGAPLDRALGRSFALVRGNVWRTIGFFIAIGVIVFSLESALTSIATVPVAAKTFVGGVSGSPLPSLGWQVFAGLVQGVARALTLPLTYVAWLLYYLDLRARREGMDLLARAQALAAAA